MCNPLLESIARTEAGHGSMVVAISKIDKPEARS